MLLLETLDTLKMATFKDVWNSPAISYVRPISRSKERASKYPNRGNYYDRQNDPAYNREVQYTHAERTVLRFSCADVHETIRLLCKDQGLNIPSIPMEHSTYLNFHTLEFNEIVETYMSRTTPINRTI